MWYVIHTMAGKEEKCLQQCRQYVAAEDYKEMFIPKRIEKKHFRQEWHDIEKTLFPGYLFVDTERIEPIQKGLQKVSQYTQVLRDGELVSPITQEEKDFLEQMMDEQHVVQYSEGLLIGSKVIVTRGPLKNIQGKVRSVDRHRRIAKMDVPIFGRMTPIEVGFGAITRVTEEQFEQCVQDNIRQTRQNDPQAGMVKVLKGVFLGMSGKLLAADTDRGEWTVEIELYGSKMEVIFQREEIDLGTAT